MVVGVAHERHIHRAGREVHGVLVAEHWSDVLQTSLAARLANVLQEFRSNIDGVHLPLVLDNPSEQPRVKPGTGSDVGHDHSRFDLARGDDLLALNEHLLAFAFKGLLELFHIGVLERIVDPWFDALLLGTSGGEDGQKEQCPRDQETLPDNLG